MLCFFLYIKRIIPDIVVASDVAVRKLNVGKELSHKPAAVNIGCNAKFIKTSIEPIIIQGISDLSEICVFSKDFLYAEVDIYICRVN